VINKFHESTCAEGVPKNIKTVIIITPSNIEVEYRLAGAGSRLAAFIIDFALQVLIIAAIAGVVLLGLDRFVFGNTSNSSGAALGFVMVAAFFVYFGYFIVSETVMNGQSPGKRIFELRVIRDNGQPAEFWQILMRGLLRASVDMLYIGLFIIIFSKKSKRLGDIAAGTIVINESYGKIYAPAANELEWPGFLPDPCTITPEERRLAEEWLRRRENMTNTGAETGEKLIAYFRNQNQEGERL